MTDNSHQLDDINPHTGEPYKIRPNKTQLKREMKVLHDLGRELVELAQNKLDEVTLSERMYDAVVSAKKMKKAALQRQFRFISSIMDEEDVDTIQLELKQLALPQQKEVEALHQLENWRDQLIAGDNALIEQLVTEIEADRQHIRQLVRNANKETQQNKPPKSSRLLFQYLKELQENAE
ncbi:ribosome biogenesis factor YjgA [Cocleimonas flava]|uniref:Dual-action ribosomal maturation protein DarP n=1 Tax=Cocleimonas flava TaxID=634765 RepID=A0A4V2P8X2_9GAMM|nr:ribosome biogenesis factor YjgA [Cocleimonas flava]TCJ87355.1 ribosome-associated protein [Cocleimonas flava]